jgi:hypothetical protein
MRGHAAAIEYGRGRQNKSPFWANHIAAFVLDFWAVTAEKDFLAP